MRINKYELALWIIEAVIVGMVIGAIVWDMV